MIHHFLQKKELAKYLKIINNIVFTLHNPNIIMYIKLNDNDIKNSLYLF